MKCFGHQLSELIAAGTFLVATSSVAQAATLTFGFDGPREAATSFTETVDGVTATVTATGGNVHRNENNGLGVTGTPNRNRLGLGETLTFGFSQSFTGLSAVIFETGNQSEAFGVTINGVSSNYVIAGGGNGTSFVNFDFGPLVPATGISTFSVFGLEPNGLGNRGIRVAGVTITVPDVAPVPLPFGAALLLSALAALSFGRWGRRSA